MSYTRLARRLTFETSRPPSGLLAHQSRAVALPPHGSRSRELAALDAPELRRGRPLPRQPRGRRVRRGRGGLGHHGGGKSRHVPRGRLVSMGEGHSDNRTVRREFTRLRRAGLYISWHRVSGWSSEGSQAQFLRRRYAGNAAGAAEYLRVEVEDKPESLPALLAAMPGALRSLQAPQSSDQVWASLQAGGSLSNTAPVSEPK